MIMPHELIGGYCSQQDHIEHFTNLAIPQPMIALCKGVGLDVSRSQTSKYRQSSCRCASEMLHLSRDSEWRLDLGRALPSCIGPL